MFFPGSRYANATTYTTAGPDGTPVAVVRLPLPAPAPLAGYHPRREGQRLDHIANFYLNDPAGFWRLCDANNAPVPDALAARAQVGIPRKDV